jgi:two-component system sensor histidine kinase/response regulator
MNAATLSSPAELLAGIPGLDLTQGLAHMAGKKPLYLAMLRRFADSHADCSRRIRQSLASGDSETAERLAHTLKSVSATLGAVDVRVRAEQLEHALREGERSGDVQTLLTELEGPLDGLVTALQERL